MTTAEDWRVLRLLSLLRVVLDTLLLVLLQTGYISFFFAPVLPGLFRAVCIGYAVPALLLLLPVLYRSPPLRIQVHLHFAIDVAAICGLVFASGGIGSGIGVLLVTPAVGYSLLMNTRTAMVQALAGTAALFLEELLRQRPGYSATEITETVMLAAILLGTNFAATTVGQRARRSEAHAQRAETDLASLAQLNERIIENMDTAVVVLDGDDRIRLMNSAAHRLIQRGPAAGETLQAVFPRLAEQLANWRANPMRTLEQLIPPAGAPDLIARPMRLEAGGTKPSTLILLDEARGLRAQAQHLKVDALGRLSASIAHEIRNPLSAIHQAGQLLAESEHLAAGDRRLLDIIERHSQRIERIVRSVLSLSRRELVHPAVLPLAVSLRLAVQHYMEAYPQRGTALDYTQVNEALHVRFDPGQLQQTLFNLWDNSFRHGERAGHELRILMQTGRIGADQQPYLDIIDNGPGIAPDLRERIFEPFFTTRNEGSGLGLYLTAQMCEFNHARLDYLPDAGGAAFRLIFSADEAAPQTEAADEPSPAAFRGQFRSRNA